MRDGFVKISAATPKIRVADCEFNASEIIKLIKQAENEGVKILVLPELCLTGATCGDLFLQDTLIFGAEKALRKILSETAGLDLLFAIGLPVRVGGKLYNCAALCQNGKNLALVPKIHIGNSQFSSGAGMSQSDKGLHFGAKTVFMCENMGSICVGIEFFDDLNSTRSTSTEICAAGANLVLCLAADPELAARANYRRDLVKSQSARLLCSYVLANAGEGESTTDLVFGGHNIIAESGKILAEQRFKTGIILSESDTNYLNFERRRMKSYPSDSLESVTEIAFSLETVDVKLTRKISPLPFVPDDRAMRAERSAEVIQIAALGLKKRIEHINAKKLVIGLSGGLDSTLALLICTKSLDMMGVSHENILAVTMPGLGTTARTKNNAEKLAEELGVSLKIVPIENAVKVHFNDIGHDIAVKNVVYENAQARERTQILMDIANVGSGIMVGTGDMSELALGWATFNGDHMSMYNVNAGIPKTLMRYLVAYCAENSRNTELSSVLNDILSTPVSPELLPPENGNISQKTEELVGPYELHDFFLYHMIRRGGEPKKVLRMAKHAFGSKYDEKTIEKWLKTFIIRFFAQQFKRNCIPDGPKVGSLSLSPRGSFEMPSDAVCRLWLEQLDN